VGRRIDPKCHPTRPSDRHREFDVAERAVGVDLLLGHGLAVDDDLNRSLEAALKPVLDVDGALRFLAVEVALVNSDGYWSRASDYNIYQDDKGVFHVIPHDVNEGLGSGGGGGGFGGFGGGGGPTLDPLVAINDPSKPLRSKLLAVPALRERYLGYVREIADRHLDWAVMGPKAQQYQALIADYVKADTRKLYSTSAFTSGISEIQRFATDRRTFLLRR
jgi:hypothetical protein